MTQVFVLENVKQLREHKERKMLTPIMDTLRKLGYYAVYRVLNALDFGVAQKRERIFIVSVRKPTKFVWPLHRISMQLFTQ